MKKMLVLCIILVGVASFFSQTSFTLKELTDGAFFDESEVVIQVTSSETETSKDDESSPFLHEFLRKSLENSPSQEFKYDDDSYQIVPPIPPDDRPVYEGENSHSLAVMRLDRCHGEEFSPDEIEEDGEEIDEPPPIEQWA